MIKAQRGVLERQSLEDNCLSALWVFFFFFTRFDNDTLFKNVILDFAVPFFTGFLFSLYKVRVYLVFHCHLLRLSSASSFQASRLDGMVGLLLRVLHGLVREVRRCHLFTLRFFFIYVGFKRLDKLRVRAVCWLPNLVKVRIILAEKRDHEHTKTLLALHMQTNGQYHSRTLLERCAINPESGIPELRMRMSKFERKSEAPHAWNG